ncbi:hypothetical protein JJQ59_14555 [Cupriavidus necator]|uniref:Uncharacterized protein n=1 Tax=Cupriavidus necator TaxID=106590 RepID=A0A367PI25_CUPNE|nr:hypothetical protein [Cupriavidus necator]QQX83626.1 hypothetical protein JJQ59_14555 [Cupriavidus necator]RCJ06755.1 hypothetical protein DDK22_19950 [Cupriavidus necator]
MTWKTHPITRKTSQFLKRRIGHGASNLAWREIVRRVLRRGLRVAKRVPGVPASARIVRGRFPSLWQKTAGRLLDVATQEQSVSYAGEFKFAGRSEVLPIAMLLAHGMAEPAGAQFLATGTATIDMPLLLAAINCELEAVRSNPSA